MKKVLAGIITAALVLTLASASALAAPHHAWAVERICGGISLGRTCHGFGGWVDTDGDGVCDNYDPSQCPGNGQGWVDTDGDGICDNYDPDLCPGNGQGQGNGGQGNGWANGGQGQGTGWGNGGQGQGGHHGGGHHGGYC